MVSKSTMIYIRHKTTGCYLRKTHDEFKFNWVSNIGVASPYLTRELAEADVREFGIMPSIGYQVSAQRHRLIYADHECGDTVPYGTSISHDSRKSCIFYGFNYSGDLLVKLDGTMTVRPASEFPFVKVVEMIIAEEQPAKPRVKALDLCNVIRDAFMAGAGVPDLGRIPDEVFKRWLEYEPTSKAYDRLDELVRAEVWGKCK